MERHDYVAALTALKGKRDVADCEEWPLTHTFGSKEFGECVNTDSPELKSKRLRRESSSESDLNQDFVFCYAAPRRKPKGDGRSRALHIPPLVLVFRSQSESSAAVEEFAHPFDSGGLNRKLEHIFGKDRTRIRDELTFRDDWRTTLGLFVPALFDSPDAYLKGDVPDRADPLGISARRTAKGQVEHDPWFFTWEVKTMHRLPFMGRLVAVLIALDLDRPTTKISEEAYQQLVSREQRGEILLKNVRHDITAKQLDDDLFDLFCNAYSVEGWTT